MILPELWLYFNDYQQNYETEQYCLLLTIWKLH